MFGLFLKKKKQEPVDGQKTILVALSHREFFKIAETEFVSLDLETTGLKCASDRVIEIGAIRYQYGLPMGEYNTFVNPGCRIPKAASAVNKITDRMVAKALPIEQLLPSLLAFIGDTPVIAHNAPFDIGFLYCELERSNMVANIRYADLLEIVKTRYPQIRNRKLTGVAWHFGVGTKGSHRALSDCQMVGEVVCKMMKN